MARHGWLALGIASIALGFACQEKSEESSPDAIIYAGSATISENTFPTFIPLLQERAHLRMGKILLMGSRQGVRYVMEGKADLAGIEQALSPEELALSPYVQTIAYDALVILLPAGNRVSNLTRSQLRLIFSGQIRNWKAVGGDDLAIEVVSQPLDKDLGPVRVFQDLVLEGHPFGPVTEIEWQHAIPHYVAGKPGAIGFASSAFKDPGAHAIDVDGIKPTPENIRAQKYPISRELRLLSRSTPTGKVKQFFDLMASPEGQALVAAKFVPAQ